MYVLNAVAQPFEVPFLAVPAVPGVVVFDAHQVLADLVDDVLHEFVLAV
jgi:hypothetical protein